MLPHDIFPPSFLVYITPLLPLLLNHSMYTHTCTSLTIVMISFMGQDLEKISCLDNMAKRKISDTSPDSPVLEESELEKDSNRITHSQEWYQGLLKPIDM